MFPSHNYLYRDNIICNIHNLKPNVSKASCLALSIKWERWVTLKWSILKHQNFAAEWSVFVCLFCKGIDYYESFLNPSLTFLHFPATFWHTDYAEHHKKSCYHMNSLHLHTNPHNCRRKWVKTVETWIVRIYGTGSFSFLS